MTRRPAFLPPASACPVPAFLPHRSRLQQALAAGLLLVTSLSTAQAVDGVSVEFGSGNEVRMARIAAQWQWERQWLPTAGRHVGGYWDLSVARWQGNQFRNQPGENQDITSIGLTPVFRWQRHSRTGLYVEGGIGVHYLSALYDNNDHQLSTRWQFGDHLGIGYLFQNQLDLSLKVQHFSNGSFRQPNDGVNLVILRLSYPLP